MNRLKKPINETADFEKIVGEDYDIRLCIDVENYIRNYPITLRGQEKRFLYNLIKYNIKDYDRRFKIYMKQSPSERKSTTLENMTLRYGDEEGQRRWDEYCNMQSKTNTYEYKKQKYGWTKEQFDEYNSSRAVTLENLISRWGEEDGTKKFEDYRKRQSYAGCKVEYFIEKYGYKQGIKKYEELNKQKSLTLENFQRKYGKELGYEKYKRYYETRANCDYYSKVSQELFFEVIRGVPEDRLEYIFFKEKNYEYIFHKKETTAIFVDFYDLKTNTVIEFNGDYWHCNPLKYKEDYYHSVMKMTAKEVWERDEARKKFMIDNYKVNYNVIWQHDYTIDKEIIIQKCKNIIGI